MGLFKLSRDAEQQIVSSIAGKGPRQVMWIWQLDAEHDNLHSALKWSLEGGNAELGLYKDPLLASLMQRQATSTR